MAVIVPALLENEINILIKKIAEAIQISNLQRMQIDFIDNSLIAGETVSIDNLPLLDQRFKWEAHLMVLDPQKYFAPALRVGFNTVIIHYESCDEDRLNSLARELRAMNLIPALGIFPETPTVDVMNAAESFEQITLLSVTPGKQGQTMDVSALARLKELKQAFGDTKKIELDGGVSTANIKSVADSGADYIVCGSSIFKDLSQTPADNFKLLEAALS